LAAIDAFASSVIGARGLRAGLAALCASTCGAGLGVFDVSTADMIGDDDFLVVRGFFTLIAAGILL